jgi:hypothetical protein
LRHPFRGHFNECGVENVKVENVMRMYVSDILKFMIGLVGIRA